MLKNDIRMSQKCKRHIVTFHLSQTYTFKIAVHILSVCLYPRCEGLFTFYSEFHQKCNKLDVSHQSGQAEPLNLDADINTLDLLNQQDLA